MGKKDIWVVKLDTEGNILWQNTYGGPKDHVAYGITSLGNDGYAAAGYTQS